MFSVLGRALFFGVVLAAQSAAECPLPGKGSATAQVVLIEGTNTAGPVNRPRTGILVSDTGVILSALNLSPSELTSAEMLGFDLATLKLNVRSVTTLSDTPAEGLIFGYDVPRNLLVIKIAAEDVERLGLKKLPLVGFSAEAPDVVCLVGFRLDSSTWRAEAQSGFEPRSGPDIRWSLRYEADHEEIGSAVLDARTGALVGIVTEQRGSDTRYLPIEYADTLLSQVFLARIVRELEALNRTASDLQKTVGWTYQITDTQEDSPTIRFLFQQYVQDLAIDRVNIQTRLVGTMKNGQGRKNVPLPDPVSDPIRPELGENYIDYTANRFLDQAYNLGFIEVDTLSVTIFADFVVPEGVEPIQSNTTTFELPFKITLPVNP